MIKIPVDNCCGCTACYSICPKEAIKMIPDQEGFLYPQVDEEGCISCGLCQQVCPILHTPKLSEVYEDSVVVQHVEGDVLDSSTSGGFIDALCRHVLEKDHGYAVGVAYDKWFMPVHIVTNQYEKAKEFRNSKYAQSEIVGVFQEIRKLLEKEYTILFVGTPCQVAGLKAFLRREYANLVTVDLVCRSIPSPKLWRMYLDWQEARHHATITRVDCRKKTYGYHSGTLEMEFADGTYYRGSNRVDYYMKSFHHDICSRPSCYDCAFKTRHRCTDFTVFDSWNPHAVTGGMVKDNDKGYSNVLAHTQKAKQLLHEMEGIKIWPGDPEIMFRFTGGMDNQSIQRPGARNTFYVDLDKNGFLNTMKKYVSVTWKDRMIERAKPIRYFLKKLR